MTAARKKLAMIVRPPDPFPSADELQQVYEDALKRRREQYGAAPTTVEALMNSLRERGVTALAEVSTRSRLADLSTAQVRNVIARLIGLRSRYPAINDELLMRLGEQL